MHDRRGQGERTGWLRVIAVFKLLKTVLLLAVAFGAFQLLRPSAAQAAERWLGTVAATYATGGLPARAVRAALDKLRFLSGRRAAVLGTASLLYAGLFATEGVGLWLGKRWAEWLTVVATGLLIPVEIYELSHGATPPRILALVVNVAMVAYLVVRLRGDR